MAAIPEPLHNTVARIFEARERAADDGHRLHLGASIIGRKCARRIWYTFRWVKSEKFSGRLLRLFERGQLEEARWWADLRRIGVEVHDVDPDGKQWRVTALSGHFGGSMDAAVVGLPEAPKSWHVAECKTHNAKSFADLQKNGVMKSKPEHFAQMQVYMHLTGMTRAVYLATNKDSDDLYLERVDYNEAIATELMKKAESIICAEEPPARISENATWYECKMCDYAGICHGTDLPEVNCRTCAHSGPVIDSSDAQVGRWSCRLAEDCGPGVDPIIPEAIQRAGCNMHRYIPIFLQKMGTQVDMRGDDVVYRDDIGMPFVNGDGEGALTSQELRALEDKSAAAMACAKKLELASVGIDSKVIA